MLEDISTKCITKDLLMQKSKYHIFKYSRNNLNVFRTVITEESLFSCAGSFLDFGVIPCLQSDEWKVIMLFNITNSLRKCLFFIFKHNIFFLKL